MQIYIIHFITVHKLLPQRTFLTNERKVFCLFVFNSRSFS